ncbi:MAG: nucleoside diphosphate kinase regulator [Thermoanaerobaculia bacterium]|nr:nucleoside diphosphate kinase regulator [Thermoanaerobaculia bacterium]
MFEGTILVTTQDKLRLTRLLNEVDTTGEDREHLDDLRHELERAGAVAARDIGPDVVTMKSRVRLLDLDDICELEYTIVYPHEANFAEGRISVLAPIGTALLGYQEGDVVEWQVPGGRRRLKIDAILYQPEASGDFHL